MRNSKELQNKSEYHRDFRFLVSQENRKRVFQGLPESFPPESHGHLSLDKRNEFCMKKRL